jgi:subtilisin family serine protease
MINIRRGVFFVFVSLMGCQIFALDYIPGEYVIKLKTNRTHLLSSTSALNILRTELKASEIRKISDTHIAVVRDSGQDALAAIREMEAMPSVEIAEPNFVYELNMTPNDPDYLRLWSLNNSGQTDGWGRAGRFGLDVGAEKAWDITTGSKKSIVAVIDSGLNYLHADIQDNLWTNEAEAKGKSGVDDDNNGYIDDLHGYDFVNSDNDPIDDHGHGTHVANIIGAKGNQGLGIVGVNWTVSIMPLKFATAEGKGNLEASVKAINYAVKMGAQVLNNSWGNDHYSEILEQTIREANSKNVLFVAAAGNSSRNNDLKPIYPASYKVPNVISVAGLTIHGYLGNFSCFGKESVHIAAPGDSIYSLWKDKYREMTGTSMAAPHVSGVAALLLSSEPQLTALEIKERLMRTSMPLGSLRNKVASGGMVNAYYALTNQSGPADPLDPTAWPNIIPRQISSSHPYLENKNETWEIYIPNAKFISLYFEKMDVEKQYDMINLLNRKGQRIAHFAGTDSAFWSPVIEGDYIKIVLVSDANNNAYGFDITKVAYK